MTNWLLDTKIELLPDVGLRTDLADWLVHKVRPMFEQRMLPVSEDILFKWRLLVEEERKESGSHVLAA